MALCKAMVNRDIRVSGRDEKREGLPVALTPESRDPAYNLGRLFAVYEYAQRSVAERNASIRDKYIGAASATPRRVFPILMRGYEHNASTLAKGDGHQRGSGVKAAKAVSQVLGLFDGEMAFPTALRLEDQARFFVGYYHQNKALFTGADRTSIAPDHADAEGEKL
jgi:CRISPR-associated protein Csd1